MCLLQSLDTVDIYQAVNISFFDWKSCVNSINWAIDIKGLTVNILVFSPGVFPERTWPKEVLEDLIFCQEVVEQDHLIQEHQ